MTTTEDNKALAIRWLDDNWNQRRAGVIDELMHSDCKGRMEGGVINDREQFKVAREGLLAAFPDISLEIEQAIAEGDTVAVRWRLKGTHKGPLGTLAATGRTAEAQGTTWFRFEMGKIVEGYDTWNMGRVLTSLSA